MTSLLEKINNLNELVIQGKTMEAFEKYYHEEVEMQENENLPTIGKSDNRIREAEFFASVLEFRSAKPLKVTVGEGVSMVEWNYDYTHKDWGVKNYTQISVQEWKNDLIVKEKFYYNA